ncbi:DUF3644 domain-containing protein [Slackia exigua]|uniref:DUF3644 domain-containing protein n=1 Tax=Slackia exigua TaxID=84109 RepID=UPI00210AF2FF|nr:DUF3644 domain-containing protein [Slackia exigua]MCQ5091248.1 DUF3644 domain-containing protein [Slackia exigua]
MNDNLSVNERLIEKSQEAFLLAIELYNRPTIRYHAEGCCFFLCNAWELMLKAHISKTLDEEAVFYPNSNRSLSLTDCIKKVFTNIEDPLRRNLEIIVELRNTSTHYVTDEYELFYGPILQYCVEKYDEKLRAFHGIEISDKIPENYLALSVRRGIINLDTIRARYPKQIVEKMLTFGTSIAAEGIAGAVPYSTELRLTKKKDADFSVRIASESDTAATILHTLTDPINKYKYRTKAAVKFIKGKLKKEGISIYVSGEEKEFNTVHFGVFVDFYEMKGNEAYSYNFSLPGEQPSWGYSQQAIDLMLQELIKNPTRVVDSMRSELKKR